MREMYIIHSLAPHTKWREKERETKETVLKAKYLVFSNGIMNN